MDNKVIAGIVVVIIVIAAVGVYFGTQGGDEGDDKPTLVITGSTTVNPIMMLVAEEYDGATLQLSASGSGQGATDCINGTNDIGMLSRDLTQAEKDAGLIAETIAYDAVAVIVDEDAGVDNLTLTEIAQIYAGQITNWNQVGGADMAIKPIVREDGSGTRDCFNEALEGVLEADYDTIMAGYSSTSSNGNMANEVSASPGGIGYVGLSYLSGLGDGVVEIAVDDVKASVETTLDGSYEITRSLILVTNGEPDADEQALLDYMLSEAGQALVEEEGYVPVI